MGRGQISRPSNGDRRRRRRRLRRHRHRADYNADTTNAYIAVAADSAAAAARAAAYAGARTYATAPFSWSALSTDATRLEKGAAASAIARSPLWPQGQPDQLHSSWQEMKAALLAAKQDWQVWTIWYDDRLQGRVRDETRELAYVRIEEALWNQGPAIVNAEIKRWTGGPPRTSRSMLQ